MLVAMDASAAGQTTFRTDPTYLIDTWETDQGLPENSATSMVQTTDGYLWFGTFNGLVRFDGVRFTTFHATNTPGLPGSGVVNMHLDISGRLWVSTLSGLAMRDGETWRTFGPADGWTGDFVRAFAQRDDGAFLATTFDGQILEWSGERFQALPPPPGDGSGMLAASDASGRWWIAGAGFIGTWDGKQWQPASEVAPGTEGIGCAPSRDGGVWVITGQSIRLYRDGVEVMQREVPGLPIGIWSMYEDSSRNLWVSTFDAGVCRIDPQGRLNRWDMQSGLRYNGVRFVFEDRESNLWIGTSGGGLSRFKQRRVASYGIAQGLAEPVIRSVSAGANGELWIGSYGKGLFRLAGDVIAPYALPGGAKPTEIIQSVLADRAGRLWVGTFGDGLWMTDQRATQQFPASSTGGKNVIALFEDSRGRIWISGGDAVAVFDGKDFAVYGEDQGLPKSGVCAFIEDQDGTLWMSNLAGVFRVEQGSVVEVLDAARMPIPDISCFRVGAGDSMWMGSRMEGLLHWRRGELNRIGMAAGLPVSSVLGILEDNRGFWWMSSDRGIVRTARTELEAVVDGKASHIDAQLLDMQDGMTSASCTGGRQPSCAKAADGRLWFATVKGVVSINPAGFHLNTAPPPVHIEELVYATPDSSQHHAQQDHSASGSEQVRVQARAGQKVILPAGSRRLMFQYTGLSFAVPETVRFQIKMEGEENIWTDVGNRREAYFHDLPPGDYVFRVRAANNDGVWNHTGSQLAFTVLPHYWQTRWFRASGAAVLIACGAGMAWWLAHVRDRRRRHADQRLRLVVDAAPTAMLMINDQGAIILVNSQTERAFGYSRTELIDQPVEMLMPERYRKQHPDLHSGFLANPSVRAMGAGRELFGQRKDGTEFPVEIGLSPIRMPPPKRGLFVLASVIDITQRKFDERDSAQQRNELAHLSRVTMLGELSGSLAHELNQPLTAILSNAQAAQRIMAKAPIDTDEIRDILGDIVEQDKRAGEVISRLRLLLKKGQVQRAPLDVNELVQEVLKLMRSDLMNHGVTVRTDLALSLPAVAGDRVQLQQVLLNLLMNGCDALADAKAVDALIVVRTDIVEGEGVRLSVKDCGHGIPPEKLEAFFEPFVSTKAHGLGLGLSVCRTIIAAHGGRLWADNNANGEGGATFHFSLPI